MAQSKTIVEIAPSRLTVTSLRAGKVADSRTARFDRTEWPQPWTDALADSADKLRQFVQELACDRSEATIIYAAPGSLASVTSCPVAAGLANAERAARLALANIADFPIETSATGTHALLIEKSAKRAGDAAVANTHVLAAADTESRTQPVCDWAATAGLVPIRLVSADSLALAQAVHAATGGEDPGVRAVLWLGEHGTVLAAGTPGRLLFVRTIAAGTEGVAEALTSPLRPAISSADVVNLSRDKARALLWAVGVPAPDQEIIGHPDLMGSSLLPHLQPAMQRLSVETKQSLRFGVPELLRPTTRLILAGPGASIPRLADVIARAAGVSFAPRMPEAPESPTAVLVAMPRLAINVAPREMRAISAAKRLRTGLLAGIAAAGALVAFEYISASAQLSQEHAKFRSVQAAANSTSDAAQALQRAIAAEGAYRALEARVRTPLSDTPACAELLARLAEAPAQIRLSSIEITSDASAGHKATLAGRVLYQEVPDTGGAINRFIADLNSVPVIAGVRLGGTSRSPSEFGDAQNFEIRLDLVGVPVPAIRSAPAATAAAAPVTGGATP